MTFLEQLEREREEGRKEGREEGRREERINTERERARADDAEKRVNALEADIIELRKQLNTLMNK